MDGITIWRRAGSALLLTFILSALAVELIAFGWLGGRLFENIITGNDSALLSTVVVCIAIASGVGILLMGYIIAFHEATDRRDRAHESDVQTWLERWVKAIFMDVSLDSVPDSRAAEEALVRLAGQLEGMEYVRAADLLETHGIVERLLADLGSARSTRRLEAIELLSLARPQRAFPRLVTLMADESSEVRIRAARAVARILAVMQPSTERGCRSEIFARALADYGFGPGVIEEMLLLSGEAASGSIRLLVESERPQIATAAFNAGGRLSLSFLYEHALTAASHEDPELRAAAFRCLTRLGPARETAAATIIRRGMVDPVWFVRVHAARAATRAWLPEVVADLWGLLGDSSWWVRRAAAEAFADSGPEGGQKLLSAVAHHADRFGRDMAAQVAQERGLEAARFRMEVTA